MGRTSTSDQPAGNGEGDVSLVGAIAIGIGGMVGGGIFAVLGLAAELAGGATPVAFAVAGVVAALTGISYSKLSVRYSSAGGTVTFIDRVFGIEAVTGAANVVLWCGYIATSALYAAAFGHYGAALLPGGLADSGFAFRILALVGVALPWLVNMTNAGLVARTEGAIVALKLIILIVVIAAGVPSGDPSRLAPSTWASPVSLVAAGMLIFVAYEGFELIANASDDIRDPSRTLPRAYGWSIGIVIVLYVVIAGVVVAALTADEIAKAAEYALAEAASASLGRVGFVLVGVSAILATFSAINATLYGAARLSATIATDGELPADFRKAPWGQPIGLHITAGLGALIAIALPLESISSLSSAIFLIVFAVVNAAAYRAGRDANVRRPVAAAGVLACIASLTTLTVRNVTHDLTSIVVLVALLALALAVETWLLRPGRTREHR